MSVNKIPIEEKSKGVDKKFKQTALKKYMCKYESKYRSKYESKYMSKDE